MLAHSSPVMSQLRPITRAFEQLHELLARRINGCASLCDTRRHLPAAKRLANKRSFGPRSIPKQDSTSLSPRSVPREVLTPSWKIWRLLRLRRTCSTARTQIGKKLRSIAVRRRVLVKSSSWLLENANPTRFLPSPHFRYVRIVRRQVADQKLRVD